MDPEFDSVRQGSTATAGFSHTVILVTFTALALYVYKESVGRFQLRRLSLPTRIYADYTPLRPGVPTRV